MSEMEWFGDGDNLPIQPGVQDMNRVSLAVDNRTSVVVRAIAPVTTREGTWRTLHHTSLIISRLNDSVV